MNLFRKSTEAEEASVRRRMRAADRDIVTLGIAVAALIMFVGTGGSVMPQIVRSWMGTGEGPDMLLANALLLNVALIIFGWRRYVELTREVRERRKAEDEARALAETDPLTGCLNRRSIGPETNALIAEAAAKGRATAQLMIDLDQFKMINDLNGHKVGDAVLHEVARRINAMLPDNARLARIGGDEFCCAVSFDPAFPDQLDRLATRIIDEVSRPIECEGMEIDSTVSIGIATTEGHEGDDRCSDAHALLHRADIGMYHAKKSGRNRYAWYETSMESELRFRNDLESGIRRGIPAGEFVPYYEQQIDLETGKLVGFEMLARWKSAQLGMIGPEIFIPIAEEIGLIGDLSECLIRQALQDASQWDPSLTLSVNISPLQLRDPWFSQKLLRLLAQAGFPAERLDVEITESCLHENISVVRSVVTSLKNQGIRISLDDFGTGYSSLAQLRSLPFDRIKIDRSFVAELAGENPNSKMVEAIVNFGHGLELPITAEGIENKRALELLKNMGKLKGQGYHYGRPEDAHATLERLARQKLLLKTNLPASDIQPPSPEDDKAREPRQRAG